MANNHAAKQVTAAGTVVLRPGADGEPEVLLVHRPRYSDWSLPKGKLHADESLPGCAARETEEESAVSVRLGIPVGHIRYPVGNGHKTVHYWHAQAVNGGKHKPNAEVDQVAWVPVSKALTEVLTYADERPLVHQALAQPDSTPLVIVRHGKAMLRSNWTGRDQARPLDERGRRQSKALVPLLEAYGVQQLVSSTSLRCAKTLQPYAKVQRLDVQGWALLSEEQGTKDPKGVAALMVRLARQAVESGVPMAVCGHRPVLPAMLEAIGIPSRPLQPGAAVVAHLGADAEVLAVEVHKPRI
jgi:8-oxo-dGTP diphosphatase